MRIKSVVRGLALALVVLVALLFLLWPRLRGRMQETQQELQSRTTASASAASRGANGAGAMAGPPKFEQPLPLYYHRGDHARESRSDAWYAERLLYTERKGPVPASLDELKKLPNFKQAALAELDEEEVAFDLKLLGDLDTCFEVAKIPPGSAMVAFFFDYENGERVKPRAPVIEASAIEPHALPAFRTCLEQAFTGSGFALKQEPGATDHVWPTTITVPARNHELLHHLLPEAAD